MNQNGKLKYVIAIAVPSVLAIISILVIALFSPSASNVLIGAILTILTLIIPPLINLLKTIEVGEKADAAVVEAKAAAQLSSETHVLVNSALAEYKLAMSEVSELRSKLESEIRYRQGLAEGQQAAQTAVKAEQDAFQKGIDIALPLVPVVSMEREDKIK